jgi:hypothetical protein
MQLIICRVDKLMQCAIKGKEKLASRKERGVLNRLKWLIGKHLRNF